jgi:hypothetical protein
VQVWTGLIGIYTDNEVTVDRLELRPLVGVKLLVPNKKKINLYNFFRYEYRAIDDRGGGTNWSVVHRVRNQSGIEIPLTSLESAWKPRTFYALADVEPYFRFDRSAVHPLRIRGGIGYVVDERIRVELIYHAQFTRPGGDGPLTYTDNIFRVSVKVGVKKGFLQRVMNPEL